MSFDCLQHTIESLIPSCVCDNFVFSFVVRRYRVVPKNKLELELDWSVVTVLTVTENTVLRMSDHLEYVSTQHTYIYPRSTHNRFS